MSSWPSKDPNDVLDYRFNWRKEGNECLLPGEDIDTYTVTIVSGTVVIDSDSDDGSVVTLWLSGGAAGEVCRVLCRIVTTEGRQYDKTGTLRIRER